MVDEKKRHASVSRRKYLKTISSSVAISGLAVANSRAESDYIRIVTGMGRDGPVQTRTVPRSWYENVKKAREVRNRLEDAYLGLPGVSHISIGTDSTTKGGLHLKQINIGVQSNVGRKIPDNVDGIPINKELTTGSRIDWQCYSGPYFDLEGGIQVENPYGGGGSMTCRVEKNGTYYMLTARHVALSSLNGCDSTSAYGKSMYQSGNYIGETVDQHYNHDAILIDIQSSNHSTTPYIVDESGSVTGHLTYNGLDYYASNSDQLEGRGISSCSMFESIYDYNFSASCSGFTLQDLVRYDTGFTQSGDSGGVMYSYSSGDILIANLISGEYDDGSGVKRTVGAAAAALNDHGWTFDTTTTCC